MRSRNILPLLLAALIAPAGSHAQIITPKGDLPIIQKVQLLFSMVSHHCHIAQRINFYDAYGIPRGNTNYAVPHLVCDPLITLYNPHPTPLLLKSARVRIWDPPVGFRFKKIDNQTGTSTSFRTPEDSFFGLARFQVENEANPSARKSFTLYLTEPGASGAPGGTITLQPGETRTFSTWVESNWTWGLETGTGYTPRSFFDFRLSMDFTNVDGRNHNPLGVQAVAGQDLGGGIQSWDTRAGFQWDNLSTTVRPAGNRYNFEQTQSSTGGWVAIRLTDTVTVEARSLRAFSSSSEPDFRISLLAGLISDPSRDIYQDFSFSADSIIQNTTASSSDPVVSRIYSVGNILQRPNDTTPGGKRPFAVLTAIAKRDSLLSGALEKVGLMNGDQHYQTSFDEIVSSYDLDLPGLEQVYVPPVTAPKPIQTLRTAAGRFSIAVASPSGVGGWTVRGGATPDSLTDDLTGEASIIPLPSSMFGARLDMISIDSSARGPHYFLRLEEPAGTTPGAGE